MTPRPPLVPYARPMRLGLDNPFGRQRGPNSRASVFVVRAVMRTLCAQRRNEGTYSWQKGRLAVVRQSWTHRVAERVNTIIGGDDDA